MKFSIVFACASIVAGLPTSYDQYNENSNMPNMEHGNMDARANVGLLADQGKCVDRNQLDLFGFNFNFFPGFNFGTGFNLNKDCGSMFNMDAIRELMGGLNGGMRGRSMIPESIEEDDSIVNAQVEVKDAGLAKARVGDGEFSIDV